jgi:D-methionine transport system ATP-binding protein
MSEPSFLQVQDLEVENLKEINLAVNAKDIIALIGKPTSGKSTLLKCLNLTLKPTKGSVSFDNKDLVILTKKELRKTTQQIAYIEANPYFIETKTVFENVALLYKILNTADNLHNAKVEDILKLVGLLGKQDNFPQELSHVQKIKLDIARSLTTEPKIILIEDFTGNSDNKNAKQLEQLLIKLNQDLGLTILISTNDPSLIKGICNQAIIMENGEIVEKTSAYDLFFNPVSDTAREYIKFITKNELPLVVRNNLSLTRTKDNSVLLRITLLDEPNYQDVLFGTLERMDLTMSIIQAYRDKIQEQAFNVVLANLVCDQDTTEAFLKVLKNHNVNSEIIGYVNTVL